MSHHTTQRLNAARRRSRKRTLARRDGARCAYCWTPFADLRAATLDHVVPISLFFTWRSENLVLACHSCNDRKADRLPLSMALLLCAQSIDREQGERVHEQSGERVDRLTVGPVVLDWSELARLAHAVQSAADAYAVSAPVGNRSARIGRLHAPDLSTHRSRSDQPVRPVRTVTRTEPHGTRTHRTRLCDAPRTRPCDGRPHAGVVSV